MGLSASAGEIDGEGLLEVYAWRCQVCKRLISSSTTPTMIIVLEPGPTVETYGDPIAEVFIKRRLIICDPCSWEIATNGETKGSSR